jgi:stage II sporulation protein AA (anti-sigma F factor antagonist)
MKETFVVKDNCLRIMMPEEMDHHSAGRIREGADEYLLSGKAQNVIFDFARTQFMDSSGIGVIAGRYKKAACFGGKVLAVHANPRIRRILMLSGLKDMIEIID